MTDFSKIKPKDKADYNTEYNLVKSQLGAGGDANALIMAFKSSKSSLKLMKALAIAMMVFGVPMMLVLAGFFVFGIGVFLFLKAKKHEMKFNYFIHLAETDPDLSMNAVGNHPNMA